LEGIFVGWTTGFLGFIQVFVTLSNVSPEGQGIHVSFSREKIGVLIGHWSHVVFPFNT
jgi:hypothetical protein